MKAPPKPAATTLCEFQVKRSEDEHSPKRAAQCGRAAARYVCTGDLGSIIMALCEHHRLHVTAEYGWTTLVFSENVPRDPIDESSTGVSA